MPRRVKPGVPAVLTPKDPAVTLTRVQSGIGVLRIEAAGSTVDGHLRVGAAYQLADGRTSIVQRATGQLTAPNRSNRPVVVAERAEFEQIRIDLRQVRQLQRLLVFAAAPPGVAMTWGGTLVTTARSTARVELPLDRPAASGVLVMASYYVVDGEITIRAEMELFATTTRDAVTAHGFDRIAWLDPYTPLD